MTQSKTGISLGTITAIIFLMGIMIANLVVSSQASETGQPTTQAVVMAGFGIVVCLFLVVVDLVKRRSQEHKELMRKIEEISQKKQQQPANNKGANHGHEK